MIEPSQLHTLISIFILIYFDYILFTNKIPITHHYYHYYQILLLLLLPSTIFYTLFTTFCATTTTIQNHQCCRCRNGCASLPNCRRPHSNNRKSTIAERVFLASKMLAIFCPFSKRNLNPPP